MFQTPPSQPPKPDYSDIYSSPDYTMRHDGQCDEGSFIRSYIPTNPYNDNGRLKVVVYLPGFCMGAAEIYHSHLVHLVKQGYYVFFPSYQYGFCSVPRDLPATLFALTQSLLRPYPLSPQVWLRGAITSVAGAYERAVPANAAVDTYLFGQSLGGLFALSWPAYACDKVPEALMPRQVITANPIPDSESLIPALIRFSGSQIGAFTDRLDISDTGSALRVPVAILHGESDIVVPIKRAWAVPFGKIASEQKRFYCAQSDSHGRPVLIADHVQATVDTSFLPAWMARMAVGGVGREDTLNWRYVWSALDQVIRFGARADQLQFNLGSWSDGVPVRPIQYINYQ